MYRLPFDEVISTLADWIVSDDTDHLIIRGRG